MLGTIEDSWKTALATELEKPYFKTLTTSVATEYLVETVYPPQAQIYAAFTHCPLPKTKVVILGQDPYHGPDQAMGLAFSVPNGTKVPPSLQNIYKELDDDLDIEAPKSGDLTPWTKQGVLLLNSTLTVTAGQPGSHQGLGWEQFTDAVIQTVSTHNENVVFLLWGAHARSKASLIDQTKHLILEAPHPSPLSAHRGFLGCGHFSKTNSWLREHDLTPVDW